jgi:hypothetical protein
VLDRCIVYEDGVRQRVSDLSTEEIKDVLWALTGFKVMLAAGATPDDLERWLKEELLARGAGGKAVH